MEFGQLTDFKTIDHHFDQLRKQARTELIRDIYKKTGRKCEPNSVEKDLSDAFTGLLENYPLEKQNPIVKEIASIFDLDTEQLKRLPLKDRKMFLYQKIYSSVQSQLKIEKIVATESTSNLDEQNPESRFEWVGASQNYPHLRPIFEEILLQKVRMFDQELTELTEYCEFKANQAEQFFPAKPSQRLKTQSFIKDINCAETSTQRKTHVQNQISQGFCDVLIRDHSQFSLKKWSSKQQSQFLTKKAGFKSNLKINNIPVLFQFVKKYTATVKARDNIYRKWEERQRTDITPEELRYLCATSVFLNNSLAPSEKSRIKKNVSSVGKALLLRLQFNIAEKIIETYKILMKKVSDLRARYYEEESEKSKVQFSQIKQQTAIETKKQNSKQSLLKWDKMFRLIVNSQKMKLKLNSKIRRWVELFIKNLKNKIQAKSTRRKAQSKGPNRSNFQSIDKTLLFKLKLKNPSSKVIKRQDQYSHRLKYTKYLPSERFEYDKSFEKSIATMNKLKLPQSYRSNFYAQLTGGPKQQRTDFMYINVARKTVQMSSAKCLKAIIQIQAKWKAIFQRRKYLRAIAQQRLQMMRDFAERVESLYKIYPPGRVIHLKAVLSRLERVSMHISNILKPYVRTNRRPVNSLTSFCVSNLTVAELQKKNARNGVIRLSEFAKFVEENNFSLLKKSGIVVNSKQINDNTHKNGANALWWAVYHSNVRLSRMFLQGGGNANSKDSDDNTCLHIAMKNGDVQTLFLLLDYGADLNRKNKSKVTCLYYATAKMLKLLGLEDGCASVAGSSVKDNNNLFFRSNLNTQYDVYREHYY